MYRPFRNCEDLYELFRDELAKLYENEPDEEKGDIRLMSTNEAAKLLNLDARAIRLLINLGMVRAIKIGERKWRVREIDLERYVQTWLKIAYRRPEQP